MGVENTDILNMLSFLLTICTCFGVLLVILGVFQLVTGIMSEDESKIPHGMTNMIVGTGCIISRPVVKVLTNSLSNTLSNTLDTMKNATDELFNENPTASETPVPITNTTNTTVDTTMPSLVETDYSGIFIKTLIIGGVILVIAVLGYVIYKFLIPYIEHCIANKNAKEMEQALYEKHLKNATLSELAADELRKSKEQLNTFEANYDPEMEELINKYKTAPKKSAIVARKNAMQKGE